MQQQKGLTHDMLLKIIPGERNDTEEHMSYASNYIKYPRCMNL